MSENKRPLHERLVDAAIAVEEMNDKRGCVDPFVVAVSPSFIINHADELRRKAGIEAQIDQLAQQLRNVYHASRVPAPWVDASDLTRERWRNVAYEALKAPES